MEFVVFTVAYCHTARNAKMISSSEAVSEITAAKA